MIAAIVRALVLYSVAEHQAGGCTSIRIDVDDDRFRVEDDGRGHAIDRTVEGLRYLDFIYSHLDYPFGTRTSAPVQLQGIGTSLINAFCSELAVVVRKPQRTLNLFFVGGSFHREEMVEVESAITGNVISGVVDSCIALGAGDLGDLKAWLLEVRRAHPSLRVTLNGNEVGLK